MMAFFNRWSIGKVKRRILELSQVYDVMYEQPTSDRYLVHVWVTGLNERVEAMLHEGIRRAVGKRPLGTKVDVLLYRRDDG